MKCLSCESEINPKWIHAIEINVCPYCGKVILEEHLKNCIAALASAMTEMLKYSEQLDDWMLSNHSYIKTSSPDLIRYLPEEVLQQLSKKSVKTTNSPEEPQISIQKIKIPDGKGGFTIEPVQVEKTQSAEQTNSFFERAEVLKGAGKTSGKAPKASDEPEAPKSVVEKTKNLAKLAQQIKTEASQGLTGENGLAVMMRPDMIDQADPDAVAEFQAAITSGDIIASGLPPASNGDDDDIPSVVQNMANRALNKSSSSSNTNEKDMQSLYEMQNKIRNAQRRLGSGGFGRSS
jgi:Zn-finger nucleic acid-binding protein